MKQHALTLVAEIHANRIESLRSTITQHHDSIQQRLRLLGTIHYCRWVIIDATILDNEKLAPQLAFESNFDGDVDLHMQDLILHLGSHLEDIYSHCIGFTPDNKLAFLQSIRIKEMAFYQGSPGRSVDIIAKEKALRYRLHELVNTTNWSGQSPISIHQQLQKAILNDPSFVWAKKKTNTPSIHWLGLILFGIVQLALAPLIILWAIYMQLFHENFDKAPGIKRNQLSDEHIKRMQQAEDFTYQNQFSQIIAMKPGKARLFTVNLLYFITRILIKTLFVKGKLMGIPTIHFARWVMVDKSKRMLFFSNFDGSWTQYLGDFIDKSGWGLTGIFGNTRNFPKALLLIFKGAYNQQEFLAWSRSTQIATQLWYVDDPTLSIKNINENTIIHNELISTLSEKKAIRFLSRI